MRFLGRRIRAAGRLMGRALCPPRSKSAVPPTAPIFRQHLEHAIILAVEAAADAARLAKSAVFAAVTSKSGRLDRPVGAPIGRSPRFANGLVSQPARPLETLRNPLLARILPSRPTTTISSSVGAPARTRAAVRHAPSAISAGRSKPFAAASSKACSALLAL